MTPETWNYERPSVPGQYRRWLEIDRTKPKVGQQIIVWKDGFTEGRAAYYRSDGTLGIGATTYDHITHWMAMPAPPAAA